MTRVMGTLQEDQYTVLVISHLRMRNVSDKSCRKKTLFFLKKITPLVR